MSTGDSYRLGITGIGLVSALGLDAVNACAAARAGLNRLRELDVLPWSQSDAFGAEAVCGHPVPLIADGFTGFAKCLALAHQALADLLSRTPLSPEEVAATGLVLLVADRFLEDRMYVPDASTPGDQLPSQRWQAEAARLGALLGQMIQLPQQRCRILHGHHAELADALAVVIEAVNGGRLQRCLVGAVDCAFEPQRLAAAADAELLKTAVNPVGHLPGEAAGFVLIESPLRTGRHGRTQLARLGTLARKRGPVFDPAAPAIDGRILGSLLSTVQAGSESAAGWLVADLNGESARAQEWGEALMRLQLAQPGAGDWPMLLPALSFGETGTAAGILGLATVLHAWARNAAPAPGAAVMSLASDNGLRAALRLDPPVH